MRSMSCCTTAVQEDDGGVAWDDVTAAAAAVCARVCDAAESSWIIIVLDVITPLDNIGLVFMTCSTVFLCCTYRLAPMHTAKAASACTGSTFSTLLYVTEDRGL